MKAFVAKYSKGQSLVEYALIIALVSVLLITALQALQGGISGTFKAATDELSQS